MGGNHACALFSDGTAKCWGHNGGGQVSIGAPQDVWIPFTVEGLACATALDSGLGNCALMANKTVYCWGPSDGGELGRGPPSTIPDPAVPQPVPGVWPATLFGFQSLTGGAVLQDGRALIWGEDARIGITTDSPIAIEGLTGIVKLAVGGRGANCALVADGSVLCWGHNESGELGDGTHVSRMEPRAVTDLADVIEVTGGFGSFCAVTRAGVVKCWGANPYGELGDGSSMNARAVPVVVSLDQEARQVSIGGDHTCAVVGDGTVRCWGRNESGQLGDGTFDDHFVPTTTIKLESVLEVGVGIAYSCALTTSNQVFCWGLNDGGTIGDGTGVHVRPTPTLVLL